MSDRPDDHEDRPEDAPADDVRDERDERDERDATEGAPGDDGGAADGGAPADEHPPAGGPADAAGGGTDGGELPDDLAAELAGIFEGVDLDEATRAAAEQDLADAGQLPPGLRDALGKLGLGGQEPDASPGEAPGGLGDLFSQLGLGSGGGELPPELAGMFEQLGLGGEGGQLPPELGAMFEQLSTPEGREELERQARELFGEGGPLGALFGGGGPGGAGGPFGALFGGGAPGGVGFGFTPADAEPTAPAGPVDWALAERVATQVVAEGDRPASAEEVRRLTEALRLAEHWLDDSSLPAPPDAGRVTIGSRADWIAAALAAMRPVVDPVARASADAMVELASERFADLDLDQLGLPAELGPLREAFEQLTGGDLGAVFRPVGAALAGLQAGQVLGQLGRTLLGQFDLVLPTGPRAQAQLVAVNVEDAYDGWGLDPTEVALVVALHEAAMRRLFHAVPWLEAHVHGLIARFASGTVIDVDRLEELSQGLLAQIDPDDPASLEAAMARASELGIEPTEEQRRILTRLQGVVCLVGAWARHEVARVAEQRVPSLPRIVEVQRRRRVERGDGEDLLAVLLGLDLQPDDEEVGERFVAAVEAARGPEGLRRTLEHPENLPDATELADPERWLARTAEDADLPDDAAGLFDDLSEAPTERSAEERLAEREGGEDEDDGDGDGDGDGDAGR